MSHQMQNTFQTEKHILHALGEIASVAEEHTAGKEDVSATSEQMTDKRTFMYTGSLYKHGRFFIHITFTQPNIIPFTDNDL